MKIAIAQIKTNPGCFEQNTDKIISYINRAEQEGADLVIFPELTIPGYMSMDLVLNDEFVAKNIECLQKIADDTYHLNVMSIVGFIEWDLKRAYKLRPDGLVRRYNSAAIINEGFIHVQDKTLFPDYDVFFENRYFSKCRSVGLITYRDKKFGVEICEDMWDSGYEINPSACLVEKGAEFIVNISASPFHMGKIKTRLDIIKDNISKFHKPLIYVNSVGGQDGYDGELVFDGRSLVFNAKGELMAMGKAFEEDFFIVDIESDTVLDFVPSDSYELSELHQALVCGIRDYCERTGFSKAVIGLSGGIDSAVTACLAVEALGSKNVVGITMPSNYSSNGSIFDSQELAKNLGIEFHNKPIDQLVHKYNDELWNSVQVFNPNPDNAPFETTNTFLGNIKGTLTEENLQARIRGDILMAYSNNKSALLITTGNKTEMALGYCTIGGDMMGGIAPLADVDKLLVYKLAEHINIVETFRSRPTTCLIPENTITKPPSAELAPGQTDEKGLGYSYEILAPLVNRLVDGRMSKDELARQFPTNAVDRCMELFKKAEFKRRQSPPGIKVMKKTFGIGRRIPMAHGF